MKKSNVGKRLLSVVLALAMMVSLFSGLGSVLTASAQTDAIVAVFYADAENPNGTSFSHSNIYADSFSHTRSGIDHYGSVTVAEKSEPEDETVRYVFRNWKSTVRVEDWATSNLAANISVSDSAAESTTLSYSFSSAYNLNRMFFSGALYDTWYRVRLFDSYDSMTSSNYIKWDSYVALPNYVGDIPAGKTFVAWKDNESGILYSVGAKVYPTRAMDFSPWFADMYKLPGYFVYFKDYTTDQIYDIKYYNPDTDDLYTAAQPEKDGYTFDCWFIDDSEYDALEFVPSWSPDKSVFYARWIPNTYDIYTQASGSSYINLSSTSAYYGDTVSFKVGSTSANENIVDVQVMGTEKSQYIAFSYDEADDTYYFTMPAEDVRIKVETSTEEYSVTFLDENGGYYATRTVAAGETLSFFEMPFTPFKAGYTFAGWQTVGTFGFGGTEFTTSTPVNSNLFVKATYTGNDFRLYKADDCDAELEYLYVRSADQDKDLTDDVTSYVTAKAGDAVTIEVAPAPTYNITGIAIRQRNTGDFVVAPTLLRKYKDAENNDCYVYAFDMPVANIDIAVYVAPNTYTVNVEENVDSYGTYRINGVDTTNLAVAQGEYATITIIPEKGYYINSDSVTSMYYDENNNEALPDSVFFNNYDGSWTYQFKMVSSDVYVSIEYYLYDYTVNVKDSNTDTFKPVWNGDEYVAVESMDEDKTSMGLITLCDEFGAPYTDWEMLDPGKSCMLPQNYYSSHVGDQICFTVTECTGYDLANVTVTYADGTKTCPVTLKDGIYYFDMPDENVFIRATFVEETYKVVKSTDCEEYNTDSEHAVMGEVNINGLREKIVNADYKDTVTVTATPKAGYYVKSISYELKDGTNNDGATVVDFSEAADYQGVQLTDTADEARTVEFIMPACDVEIFVTYGKIDYSVTTEVTSGDDTGTVTVAEINTYLDEVTFTLEPAYGYVLDSLKVVNLATGKKIIPFSEKINQTYGAEYSFEMPAAPVMITANYVKDAYTVTYLDKNNSFIGSEAIEYKDTATLYPEVVSVPNGFHFVGWISNDTETAVTVPSLDTADFVIIKNTVIWADYDYDKTNVCFAETENGYVAPANSTDKTSDGSINLEYEYEDFVAFDIIPDEGYVIDEINVYGPHKDGDKDIHIDCNAFYGDTYYFNVPAIYKNSSYDEYTYDIDVVVTFKKDTFELTKDVIGENGTVEVNGNVTTDDTYNYEFLDEVTITATPDKGYFVKSIVATMVDTTATNTEGGEYSYTYYGTVPDNDVYGTTQSIKFPMPATDMTYTVTYAKCNFTITSIVESGAATGTLVAPELKQIDDEIEFTITPSYGYIVDTLSVTDNAGNVVFDTTDIDRTYGGTYKFVMPASPVTISVNYIKDAYVVTYKDSDNSVIFTEAIKFEETATLNTAPEVTPSGNHFIGWISADTKVPVTTASLNKNDFVINKATVITAVYEIDNTKVVVNKTVNGYAYNGYIAASTTKTAAQSHVYKYGDTVTLKAVPDEGYKVESVTVTCKAIDGVATNFVPVIAADGTDEYSFVIPAITKADVFATDTGDLTVDVIFCKATYTLAKKEAYENGTVAINGAVDTEISYTYDYLQLVTITATPDKGYYVKSIVAEMDTAATSTEDTANDYAYTYTGTAPAYGVDGEPQTIRFPMPATDMHYVVVFDKCQYNITTVSTATTPGTHGKVTTDPANVAKPGDLIVVTADPDDGYSLAEIKVLDENNNPVTVAFDSLAIDHIAKYTFTMPSSNVTVTVLFKQAASREYIDVRDDGWYYDAVNFVSDKGYFVGYGTSGEIFGVNDHILRQDFVVVLARMNGVDLTPYKGVDLPFVDVSKNAYYAPAIAWAYEQGIVFGYADGSNRFGVGDSIKRQDIVSMLYRYCEYMHYKTDLTDDALGQKEARYVHYRDLNTLSSYAEKAMAWGVGYGVLRGTSDSYLSPTKTATRSEVAQMIKNLFDHNIAR